MRKIELREVLERKQQRRTRIFVLLMLGLLVVSTIGYSFTNIGSEITETKISDNGVEFIPMNGVWSATISEKSFLFRYLPSETQSVKGAAPGLSVYSGKTVYLVGNSSLAESEIVVNLQGIPLKLQRACNDISAPCAEDTSLPLKTCDDYLIILEIGKPAVVLQEKKCVYLSGMDDVDLVKTIDAFFYKSLGILS